MTGVGHACVRRPCLQRQQPKVYKILKQISKDVKETTRIQGNIDENVFLKYYEKLWNTTNINELQLEHNSADYLHAFINLDELEKVKINNKW